MTIEAVCKIFNTTPSQLRYYEKHGIIASISRSQSGHRQYTKEDLAWIEFILFLKNLGMPLNEIKQYIHLKALGVQTLSDRKALLTALYEKNQRELLEKAAMQEKLQHVIDFYDEYPQNEVFASIFHHCKS